MGEYFLMNLNLPKIKNILCLTVIGLLFLPAFADDSTISSVVISKAKNKPDSYELNIDSTNPVDFKENKEDSSMVYFDLKNSVLAEDAGVVYDDATNIDNVIVKQIDKNKVRIYVKGNNVKNTELVFVNSLFETKEKPKKITINRPINEYKSIDETENSDLESQDDIQDWDDNSFNFSHLMSEIFSGLKKDMAGILGALLLALIFMGLVIKNAISKIYQDTEPLIGLNHAKEHDKENIYSSSARKPMIKEIRTGDIDFEGIATKNKALKQAQEQLSKAHNKYQAYLQNKYKNSNLKTTSDTITRGIALNQYRKSNQNPYPNQEVIKMNSSLNNLTIPEGSFKIPPRPKKEVSPKQSNIYMQKTQNVANNPIINKENTTSLQFLESVTKIYEQSGREDLAMGLKNSISKTKQKI